MEQWPGISPFRSPDEPIATLRAELVVAIASAMVRLRRLESPQLTDAAVQDLRAALRAAIASLREIARNRP